MRDRFIWLVSIVVVLTLLSACGAVTMTLCMTSPPSIITDRLLEMAVAGFFTILGLLTTLHVR